MGSISKLMGKFDGTPDPERPDEQTPPSDVVEQPAPVEPPADDAPTQSVDKATLPVEWHGGSEEPASAPAGEAAPAATESRFEAASPAALSAAQSTDTEPWDAARVDSAVITFHNRFTSICEQYRSIRARLLSTNPKNRRQVIVITSSVPEEGKSVTSMNLGISMAEGGEQRVLVADTDFRRSSVAKMIGISNEPGLTDVLLGRAKLDDVIRPTPYPNLKVIPAGRLEDRSYGELLASPAIREVLNQVRASFSYTFLDTPPVNTVSDVSMIGPFCDGALMVVEMGRTPEPTVQLAVRSLQTNNVNVLGCVLSRYTDQRKHYYDRYYGYYYHHR